MGYIKNFIMDNEGAGWKSFDELSDAEKLELDLAIRDEDVVKNACVICFIPIQGGNTCDTHKGQKPNW
jgi:hypothetical protein